MTRSPYLFNGLKTLLLALSLIGFQACQNASEPNDNTKETSAQQEADADSGKRLYPEPGQQTTRGQAAGQNPDTNTLTIGYVDWTEGIAMTHIVEEIIESRMDITVNKRKGYVGQVLDSLAMGTNDIFLDHWLAADSSMDEMSDFNDLGINYKDACMGLVVPEYMDVDQIPELKEYDGTKRQIIGIDEGSDVMQQTRTALKAYDLDYKLAIGSGPAMVHQLQQKVENQEPVIVTGWRPHWKFGRFDLKFLDDPKKIYGARKNIHTLSRKGLEEDHPRITAFLRNFRMNTRQLANLMEMFAQSNDWENAAERWCANHSALIDQWMPERPA
jgi:glycine betaine/proline transport system substrate-binding protein